MIESRCRLPRVILLPLPVVHASRSQIPVNWKGPGFDLAGHGWSRRHSADLNASPKTPIGEMNDDLSIGIHSDMPHFPAAVSDEAGAGPQLDELTDRFNRFRLADLADRHLGMDTHAQKRERSTDSSIASLVGTTRTLTCLPAPSVKRIRKCAEKSRKTCPFPAGMAPGRF